MGIEQHVAQATNLVFFIPTSIVAIIVNMKQKLIDFKIAIPIAVSGVLGAVVGAMLATKMDVKELRKYFGIFLAIIAIGEIYSLTKQYIFHKKSHNKDIKKIK